MTLRIAKACFVAGVLLWPAVAAAQTASTFAVNGYSSFEFEKQLGEKGKGDPNGSFDADLFDLVFNFTPASRLRVASDLTWEHGAASEDGRGNVAVEYAFAEPAFLSVKEPLSTNKNDKFGSASRLYPRWQAGIAVLGDAHVSSVDLDYVVQLSNGEQSATNPFEEDDNKAKAVTARLRIHPTRQIAIGASLYGDSRTEYGPDGEDTGRASLMSYGASLTWMPSSLGLELEYVRGHVDASQDVSRGRSGLTAMAYYRIRDRYTPYFRYEWLDPDSTTGDDNAQLFICGVNVRVANGLYLKADLDTVKAGSANARFKGQGYTELKAAAVVGF
jgi:hypothetical protein